MFCFSVYCSLLDCFDNDDAILRTLEFNKGFKQPLSDSELRQALSSASEKGYKITNEWIINSLNISEEEQDAINLFTVNKHTSGRKARNHSRDTIRKALKEDRDNKICAMYETGISKAQIARLLGISRNTVISTIKALEAEIEAAKSLSGNPEPLEEEKMAAGAENLKIESSTETKVFKNGAYIYVSYSAIPSGGVKAYSQSNNRDGPLDKLSPVFGKME